MSSISNRVGTTSDQRSQRPVLEPVATDHQESTVRRSTPDHRFVLVSAEAILNPELSAKAKGLVAVLAAVLAGPNADQLTVKSLAQRVADGEASVKGGLTELETRGYLTREVQRDDRGRRTGIRYVLHETPRTPETRQTA